MHEIPNVWCCLKPTIHESDYWVVNKKIEHTFNIRDFVGE